MDNLIVFAAKDKKLGTIGIYALDTKLGRSGEDRCERTYQHDGATQAIKSVAEQIYGKSIATEQNRALYFKIVGAIQNPLPDERAWLETGQWDILKAQHKKAVIPLAESRIEVDFSDDPAQPDQLIVSILLRHTGIPGGGAGARYLFSKRLLASIQPLQIRGRIYEFAASLSQDETWAAALTQEVMKRFAQHRAGLRGFGGDVPMPKPAPVPVPEPPNTEEIVKDLARPATEAERQKALAELGLGIF